MNKPVDFYELPIEVERKFETLFIQGQDESFEDGMESQFSTNLLLLMNRYNEVAIEILVYLIIGERVNPVVAAEALRWVGRINDSSSHRRRRWLLERALTSPHSRVRDGAALGLAFMDDPAAIPSLRYAVEREDIDMLRQDMTQVLEQLEQTRSQKSS
jgi:hypothetical protein